jgi:hypothetical protein
VTLNDVQKAELALFAARAAGQGASLEQMKAICYVIRNRVRAGWHDGQWLTVMERAAEVSGNLRGLRVLLDPNSRTLQRLIADVDDIYYRPGLSGREQGNTTAQAFAAGMDDLGEVLGRSLYWCFINQPMTPWFVEHVIHRPDQHPSRVQMGTMMFYEERR